MKIDKAIEELMVLKDNPSLDDTSALACQMGIEALYRIKETRKRGGVILPLSEEVIDKSDKLVVELERKYPAEGSK